MAPAADTPQLDRMPVRSMLSDEVYDVLREGLLSGRIEPGARLNLDRLARQLHVSNTPVRQALARLVSDGLVIQTPYRGFSAAELLDEQRVRQIYEFRLILEPGAARLAATRRSAEDSEALIALTDPGEVDAMIADGHSHGLADRDGVFHQRIAASTGNHVLHEHLEQVLTRMPTSGLYSHGSTVKLAWEEHRAIAAAIEAGDDEAAAHAMKAHLMNGMARMRAVRPA